MNTHRCLILAVLVTCIATAARAGSFSRAAWTNDASSGITAGQTAWAYHFGATTTAVVNGISVTGIAGPTASNAHFDLTGPTSAFNGDTNSLTALGGTSSAGIAGDFVYGGNPTAITLKGLTVGQSYAVSILSVGWIAGQTRVQGFESDGDGLAIDPQFYGQDQGVRVDYVFTATATTRTITITPDVPSNTFHLYGLALRQTTGAGSLVVSNGFDSGTGSLRQTLADAAVASGANTLTFDAALSGATLTLSSEIIINDATGAVTVDATSLPGGLTIDGGPGANRIFSVSSGKSLALLGLTVTGGNGGGAAQNGNGGAIVNFGTLALTRCTLSGNSGGSGGAILNDGGTMALAQCTLSGNSTSNGGAILQTTGTLTLTQCTLAGNQASNDGGAIYNQTGALTLTHCTLSGNSASSWGGAIRNLLTSLTLANSLVAGNGATFGGSDIFSNSTPTPTGVNFIGNPAGCGLTAGPAIRTTAANGPVNLSPLGSNGGPTKTMVPRPGSPAIDVPSFITGVTTDQRGFPRPVENGPSGGLPDIGAVESQTVVVTTAADQIDTPTGAQTSLREALRDGADRVLFSPALAFQAVGLDSQISVAKYVTIDASSIANGLIPSGMIVSANDVSRIFHIAPGVTAEFIRLMITTGQAATNVFPDGYGGGAYVEGALTLTECTLQGNSAYVGGAAYVANSATASLTLQRCTVSGNTASYGGGIQNEGTFACHGSTFAENEASVEGGAISAPFNKPVTLRHCTVSQNTAGTGGGTAGNVIQLNNSVVSGNTAPSGPDFSGGISLIGMNWIGGNALLAPLGDYGGPTKTMALKPGSPLRNFATVLSPAITSDQRGFPIIGQPDTGAYEAGTFTNFNAWIWETLPATATPPQHATTFDFDGDGQTNQAEWLTQTDPGSGTSRFFATPVRNGANLEITFPTSLGRTYQLQSSPNLANPWTNIGSPTPGTGGNVTLPVSMGAETRYFFRVSVSVP